MHTDPATVANGELPIDELELLDWTQALQDVLHARGPDRVKRLLEDLQIYAQRAGVWSPEALNTPYVNTIPVHLQSEYPGNQALERRIKSIIRWNAMAMVVKANMESDGIGGHISTFASAATLYEVAQNHFFKGPDHPSGGDIIYFQGHGSPGMYARAFLEGRLNQTQLTNFRRELQDQPGLPSYPHPWLMPDFWNYPTVSMGLGPLMSIYQARFMRYMQARGLEAPSERKVWAFVGDGEIDEPESLAGISLATRAMLDNLIWVVNCNLQRLDGPVRGNSKIIQELEAIFRGAGWHVIKVLWGSDWDELFERDQKGLIARRLRTVVDGDFQKYSVSDGAYLRSHFWNADPELAALVADKSDDELWRLTLGGHDPIKVYAAYHQAMRNRGAPTVILARTIKGYGLGEAGEGRNITHQQKKLNADELLAFRDRFQIPISDQVASDLDFHHPGPDSREVVYMKERRRQLGGSIPERRVTASSLRAPSDEFIEEFLAGSGDRVASTTMAYVRILTKLLRDPELGRYVVPIVPDEARTFGMEALFRQCGIFSPVGQRYEPVDSASLLPYRETVDGQILQEGINEAGSMSSFIAAGTSLMNYGQPMIPFYTYYSMFGMQRVGDLVWAAADSRTRGFLVGGTAGRTTLAGEGLQHQDGHSHLLASAVPNLYSYDPAFAYEIAVIIQDGIRRMFQDDQEVFYYLTVGNENYRQPPMPDDPGVREGIVKGLYKFSTSPLPEAPLQVNLIGSGPMLNEAVTAQAELADRFDIGADVWSATSLGLLRSDADAIERWNMLHPNDPPRVPYVRRCLGDAPRVSVSSSDYVKAMADSLGRWTAGPFLALGTDGFGRSEARSELRDFFEIDHRYMVLAALGALAKRGEVENSVARAAIAHFQIDPEKANPVLS
ncbi:MAG: pyruvate dehydrogenase (acetyl-transferring), homodimeric type [Chloroflexota bacterium]|nr:pyruvate dehydrogenase (acetyl-transferring), homodimeric type [Chloroflexota bacterium]